MANTRLASPFASFNRYSVTIQVHMNNLVIFERLRKSQYCLADEALNHEVYGEEILERRASGRLRSQWIE
jgi:hypothetical protein